MKRFFSALTILALGSCVPPHPGPPPGPPVKQLVVRVRDGHNALLPGASVHIDQGPVHLDGTTDTLGGAIFHVPNAQQAQLTVTPNLPVCDKWSQSVNLAAPGEQNVALTCHYAPPIPPKASVEQMLDVQANFCNLADESGKPEFTVFLLSLPKEQRQVWYARQRAAGSRHIVVSPQANYPGAPWASADAYADAPRFVDLVQEIIETPGADGNGFTPLLFLDGGEANPRPRISANWPPIVSELQRRGLLEHVIIVPGWELVNASSWSSADLSFGLELLHSLGVPHIGVHLSPTRASGASNPVAQDDPWQGAESGFWKDHGGQYAEIFFYESENLRQSHDQANCSKADPNCWLSRWDDVVPRLGNGMNGWRVMHLVLFETVAYGAWHGDGSPQYADDVATAGKALCTSYGVHCGFGNGRPQ